MSSERTEPLSNESFSSESGNAEERNENQKDEEFTVTPSSDDKNSGVQSSSTSSPAVGLGSQTISTITPTQESTVNTPPTSDHLFTPPNQAPPKNTNSCSHSAEDDNLKFIKEQLNFLNNESGELATPIHKSNKQKRQELARKHQELAAKRKELQSPAKQFLKLHCRGIKRSPQKIKPRKPKRVRRSIGFADSSPEKEHISSGADADTSDDTSDDDNWKIIDSSDTEIDKALEENASKQNLTVMNVRNILHQVITNEDVVAMVRNTIQEVDEDSSESPLVPATYEPKMTRSKFKEVLQKDGTIHHPWPLSPLKKVDKPKTSFLDLPLPDEDEDEDDEYNPEKEIELGSYSDEDSESVASSQVSDFGSPRPSTPATPSSVSRFSDLDKTSSIQEDEEQLKSPMGPPTKLPITTQKNMLGKRFHIAMAESDKKAKKKEEETIALRTRSKLSLTDTSLNELESNFVAPDITWDMYDTSCDDREWMTFLTELQLLPENDDTVDDDNDPEYNYLAEAEEEDIDMEDFRCDRAVQVSRKEMNELMDELLEAYQDTENLMEEDEKELLKKRAMETVRITTKKPVRTIIDYGLTESHRIQLDHQMRKHVQLLTQTYVLASANTQDYEDVRYNSKLLLNELQKFSEVNSTLTTYSSYKACNLEEAVQLVNEDREFVKIDPKNILVNRRARKQQTSPSKRGRKSTLEKDPSCMSPEKGIENMLCRNYKQLTSKQKDMIYNVLGDSANFNEPSSLLPKSSLPNLTTQQKEIFWRSLMFIYPELLPHGNFILLRDSSKSPRVCFTEAEDNLLALGFEQFRSLPMYRKLIQKFILPCKTEDQIKIRIKNLTAKTAPDNPIKTYKAEKKLPYFPPFTEPFDINEIKPAMKQDASILPVWCKEMKIKEIILIHDDNEVEGCNPIQRSSSVNIPVVQHRLVMLDMKKCKSAPTTPILQQEDLGHPQTTNPKVLQFDFVKSAENTPPSSPKVTQLQDIGRKRCASPGFIKLLGDQDSQLENPASNQGQPTPSNVSIATQSLSTTSQVCMISSGSIGQMSSSNLEISSPVRKTSAIMIMHGQTPATCAAPTFVVVNKNANAELTGRIDSTVLSSALPSSICSVIQTDVENSAKVISPTKLIDDISKEVQNEITPEKVTPTKRAADIVASLAPYYLSPELLKDSDQLLSQQAQEQTPKKNSPSASRFRPVAPKPIVLSTFTSPVKKVSPFLEKRKLKSPRRKQLQTKAQSIRPKGFIPNRNVSPVKKAASNIINRALRRPKILLPKPLGMVSKPFHLHVRKTDTKNDHEEEDISYLHDVGTSESEGMEMDYMSGDCIDTMDFDESKICNKPSVFSSRQKHNSGSNQSVESDDTQSEVDDVILYDSQNEDDVIDDEDHLADLMAASTTICFASQRQIAKDKENRRKGMKKKDKTIAMLAPDLLEEDPLKDDKDTAFAQAYLNRTKEVLKGDTEKYEEFLKILYNFGKSEQSPVMLYQELRVLLADYPDLVGDFAGFLLPEQALECGCSSAAQEFKRAKTFLRKLEVYLARHPSHYQKVMKTFSRWSQSEKRNVKELREALEPMLKLQPHLLEELTLFFEDERPPESYLTDYEEINLDDSDQEPDPDGFEVIELPDEQDINGTKLCQCNCHKNTLDQNYLKRNRHCYSCCLKVIDGELYFRVSNKVLKKVSVIYHKPIKARSHEEVKSEVPEITPPFIDDDPVAEKENVDISLLPPTGSRPFSSKKKKEKTRYSSGSEMFAHYQQDLGVLLCDESIIETMEETDSSETVSEIVIDRDSKKSGNLQENPEISNKQDDTVVQGVNIVSMNEEANNSPRKSEPTAELTSSSSTTLPYSVIGSDSTTCPDILAKALKVAMIGQGDVSMDISLGCQNQILSGKSLSSLIPESNEMLKSFSGISPMLSSSRSEKHFVKELFASSSDSSDSNSVKPIVTMAEEMSNIGIIKSLDPSENPDNIISTIVQNEDSSLSGLGSSKLLSISSSNSTKERLPTVVEENISDIPKKSPISDVTFKTFGKDVKGVEKGLCNFSFESKTVSENFNNNAKSSDGVSRDELESGHSNSMHSETRNVESPKSVISIVHPEIESSVIGFSADSNGSGTSKSRSTEINRLTPRRATMAKDVPSAKTVGDKGGISASDLNTQSEITSDLSESESNSVDTATWNKDADRIILEEVKANGPGSETFDSITKKLPGKSSQQISQRFHQLLEILASEETPSEDDNEEDKISPN